MAAREKDGLPLNTPLLVDEKQYEVKVYSEEEDSKGKASFFKTCFHTINSITGSGIISIPFALASGGWLSLTLLFVISIASYYSGMLIQKCMEMNSNIKVYQDLGQHAFGYKGRVIVLIAMNYELYMVVTGYLILEGDNMNKILPNFQVDVAGLTISGTQLFILVTALIILPILWLDNLVYLSYVSATGALASIIFLCALFWYGTFDGPGFNQKGTLIRWSGIPSAVSLFAFCYSTHPVFPNLYTTMRNKTQFSNVLLVSFSLCTFIYAATAVLGYLMFGSKVASEITLNLASNKVSTKVAIYIVLVSPIAKYPLTVTPVVDSIKSAFPPHYNKRITHVVVSTFVLISTVVVAMEVPFFAYLMSLSGALCSVTCALIVPCVCYLKITDTFRKIRAETIINWGIIVLGVAIAIVGTYVSVVEIIQAYDDQVSSRFFLRFM
ncbi:hypothetical protein L6164_028707 [Bauhinia variegata]|uniref:Uncharacterized protein n=1 Tax=Bauhinia variegata TaxID=167791 RepID=A0ACB9L6I7_BAUVA|nr:hypothetical protein L6164_028707 [Bauhinia variegata]